MKTCTRCKIIKSSSNFTKRPKSKDGLREWCRLCENEYDRAYRQRKREETPLILCIVCNTEKHYSLFPKLRRYKTCLDCRTKRKEEKYITKNKNSFEKRIQHKDGTKRCSICRIFKLYNEFWKSNRTTDGLYSSCIECKTKSESQFKERRHRNQRNWVLNNIEYIRVWRNNHQNKRAKTDPEFKLRRNVSSAIIASIRNYSFENMKSYRFKQKIFSFLPYTTNELKAHIELLWEPWMNWDNHGKFDPNRKTWQLDHIIPQSKLLFKDLRDDNFQKLWALSNLQPLETIANIKKGNKISGTT